MKTFNFRKLTDGEHKGKSMRIFDGDEMLGLAHMPSMKWLLWMMPVTMQHRTKHGSPSCAAK